MTKDTQNIEDLNFDQDLAIDETALDVEWLDQPRRYMKYCKLYAEAGHRVRRIEERMKILRSQIILKAASKGTGRSGGPTQQQIEASFRVDAEHQRLKRLLNSTQHVYDLLNGAVFAFQQRKTALEQLVTLYGQQYFAGPSLPRDLSAERLKHLGNEKVKKRVDDSLNRQREVIRKRE